MPSEQALGPEESLEIISDAILRTREDSKKNSYPFLLWGWLVASASFLFYVLATLTSFKYYFLPFPIFAVIGVFSTLVYYRKKMMPVTQTYLQYFLSRLWMIVGLAFFLTVFVSVNQGLLPFPFTLIIAGIGTLVSGLTMKFKPLIWGGVLFFCASLACVFVADDVKVLVHGFAIIAGYLVPGYLLKASNSQANQ
jgi:hypothetical protein